MCDLRLRNAVFLLWDPGTAPMFSSLYWLQILYARDVDQRSTTFEKSLQMGKEFQRRAKAMILRAAVLRNQIHVKVWPCSADTDRQG